MRNRKLKDSCRIADFYGHENRLVVEIDGKMHLRQKDYDRLRSHVTNVLGRKVIRFKNESCLQHALSLADKPLSAEKRNADDQQRGFVPDFPFVINGQIFRLEMQAVFERIEIV